MSKLPICERVSLKSFIKGLRAYRLNQQRPSNIDGLENFKVETQVLVDQQEQTLQLKVIKEESLELNYETAHTRLAKEELQEHDHQQSNLNIVKEEKDSRVDIQGHLKKGCNR